MKWNDEKHEKYFYICTIGCEQEENGGTIWKYDEMNSKFEIMYNVKKKSCYDCEIKKNYLIIGENNGGRIVDMEKRKVIKRMEIGSDVFVQKFFDEMIICSGCRSSKIYLNDIRSRKNDSFFFNCSSSVYDFVKYNNNYLISGCIDGCVSLFDLRKSFFPVLKYVESMKVDVERLKFNIYNKNDEYLIFGDVDGYIKQFKINNGELVYCVDFKDPICSIEYYDDYKVVLSSLNENLYL